MTNVTCCIVPFVIKSCHAYVTNVVHLLSEDILWDHNTGQYKKTSDIYKIYRWGAWNRDFAFIHWSLLLYKTEKKTREQQWSDSLVSFDLWSLFGWLMLCVCSEHSSRARVGPLLEQWACCGGICTSLGLIPLGQPSGPVPSVQKKGHLY